MNEEPVDIELSTELRNKLLQRSVVQNDNLPLFFSKFLLQKFIHTHIPKGMAFIQHNS